MQYDNTLLIVAGRLTKKQRTSFRNRRISHYKHGSAHWIDDTTGNVLDSKNVEVGYVVPLAVLFGNWLRDRKIDTTRLSVKANQKGFTDDTLNHSWRDYHRDYAELLIQRQGTDKKNVKKFVSLPLGALHEARRLIRADVRAFRTATAHVDGQTGETYWTSFVSGRRLDRSEVSVDHVFPFQLLFRQWVQTFEIDPELLQPDPDADGFGSVTLNDSWKQFHNRHAQLRIVSNHEHKGLNEGASELIGGLLHGGETVELTLGISEVVARHVYAIAEANNVSINEVVSRGLSGYLLASPSVYCNIAGTLPPFVSNRPLATAEGENRLSGTVVVFDDMYGVVLDNEPNERGNIRVVVRRRGRPLIKTVAMSSLRSVPQN